MREAPEPIRSDFEQLREGFLKLVGEIERVTLENRRLATVNLDAIRGTLGLLAGQDDATSYDAEGKVARAESGPTRLDRVL